MSNVLARIHKCERGVVIGLGLFLAIISVLVAGGILAWELNETFDFFGQDAATPTIPDRAVNYEWVSWGEPGGSGGIATLANSQYGVVVSPASTILVDEVDFRLGRSANGDKVLAVLVYEWEDSDGLGDYIGTSVARTLNSLTATTGVNQWQPWATFTFEDEIYLYAGTWYTIFVHVESGSTGTYYVNQVGGTPDSLTQGYYHHTAEDWYDSAIWWYLLKGYESAEPQVETTGHVINLDGSITLRGWVEVIGNMDCGFLVSANYTAVAAGTGTAYPDPLNESGWNAGRFPFQARLTSLQNNVQYSYRAFATAYSTTWYGEVLNFTRTEADVPLTLQCHVITNNVNGVTFESYTAGINSTGNVTYNLTIAYGQNLTQCQAANGTISVANVISADGIWQTTSTYGSDFTPGTQYWYRLAAAGNDSSLAYSDARSFTAYDETIPDWLQWLLTWLNEHLGMNTNIDTATWWIIGLLFLGAWTLAGLLKWKWLGVIGTAALFVWLVVNEMVPVWIVILAVLLAGWIIFKMIFTRAHEETGD